MGINPFVSIIIPCYLQAQFLGECLASIYRQTYTNWKVIVVNDFSPDREEIIQTLKMYDDRSCLLHHDVNRGLAAARNTGIKYANTDWVLPVDADDRLASTYLSKTIEPIRQNTSIDAVFTDFRIFGDSEYIKNRYIQSIEEILDHHSIPGAGTLYRRSLWQKIGGYCENSSFRAGNEDWDFWITAYELGFTPFHIPEPLYEYRRYPNTMVGHLQFVDYQVRNEIYKRHRKLFDKYNKKRQFLAKGFENSARANFSQKAYLRSSYLAFRGWTYIPSNRKLVRLGLKSLVMAISQLK